MSEGEIVDARGLGCPQPVILAKRALEREASVLVIVDNAIARENVRRLGVSSGCDVQTADPGDGTFRISLTKRPGADLSRAEADLTSCGSEAAASGRVRALCDEVNAEVQPVRAPWDWPEVQWVHCCPCKGLRGL